LGSRALEPRKTHAPTGLLLGAVMTISAGIATALVVLAAGCGNEVDPTPEKLDGTPSQEFEQEDLDAADGASDAVEDYCADAVSEAQRLGCESHVTEEDIP